jgi:nucleotide-binding universal stress UspA family protein
MKMKIVVASDGNPAATGALRLAAALARRHECSVEVVAVMERLPVHSLVGPPGVAQTQRQLEDAGQESLQQHVKAQLATLGPAYTGWPLTVALGPPAPRIVRLAEEKQATLLLLGMGRHSLADRWLGTETALRVMRVAHIPVIAVPSATDALPTSALCAADFSEFSRDAAETMLDVLEPGGTLHLAHVYWSPPYETPWVGGMNWVSEARARARHQLEELALALEGRADVRVPTHYLEGDPARELLRLAESLGAQFIAAGSHGPSFFGRIMMGSVSRRLVRGASCPVLVAPPRAIPAEVEEWHRAEFPQPAVTA